MAILTKHVATIVALGIALIMAAISGTQFYMFRRAELVIVPGVGVTEIQKLSDYFAPIKGSAGDADIYVLGSQNPDEPSMLILGGNHPNEPAAVLTAILMLENIVVNRGTVYVIPQANKSAMSHTQPQDAAPMYYDIETSFGSRTFKYGSRATNPLDQWPIPELYIHQPSGSILSGTDTRNLNRAFPGRANGTYTEKIAHSIVNLIKENNITMTLDLHEASPEYPVNNAIIAHGRAIQSGIAGLTMFALEGLAFTDSRFDRIKQEPSPINLRGLTHRELGDHTQTLVFLAETSNASMGRIRGETNVSLIIDGDDKFYQRATALGILAVDHSSPVPIEERVGRHTQLIVELINAYNVSINTPLFSPTGNFAVYNKGAFEIDFKGLSFDSVYINGVGHFLNDPDATST